MNWTHQRIIVTGASGFIGSHLTERLVELGWSADTPFAEGLRRTVDRIARHLARYRPGTYGI